jgi:16S rRNA (cytosine967-C5)-methyltransferase
MTPAARLAAAIDILHALDATSQPADRYLVEWGRRHRFAGAKDRAAIAERVFCLLRRRGEFAWAAGRDDPRALALAALICAEGLAPADAAALFGAGPHAPAPLDAEEQALPERIAAACAARARAPLWAQASVPEWLAGRIEARFGADAAAELMAFLDRAPLDLRVNTLRSDRARAQKALMAAGVETIPCPLSPIGLRVVGRERVSESAPFARGLVEVQDEGSQIAALLADARPGQQVLDLCAGAGGKTLALAARMENHGQIYACDSDARRLGRLPERVQRAGVRNVQIRRLPSDAAEQAPALAPLAARMDRVVVDAPCSGSGAWRRRPETKWRLTPERLAAFAAVQDDLLERAAALLRPDGRLVYITCSIVEEENEARIAALRARRPELDPVPVAGLWAEILGPPPPWVTGESLLLTPRRSGTDGFFVAILERRS